jgi:hypothetical protein
MYACSVFSHLQDVGILGGGGVAMETQPQFEPPALFRIKDCHWHRTPLFYVLFIFGLFMVLVPMFVLETNFYEVASRMVADNATKVPVGANDDSFKYDRIATRTCDSRIRFITACRFIGLGLIALLVIAEANYRADWRCKVLRATIRAELQLSQPTSPHDSAVLQSTRY